MSELKKIAMDRALAMLKAAECKFIVVEPDGTQHTHGDLRLAPPEVEKKRTRTKDRPYGALVEYYRPLIENLQPNDFVKIPFNGFERGALQGAISSTCGQLYGSGNYMTHSTDEGVEVLRLL